MESLVLAAAVGSTVLFGVVVSSVGAAVYTRRHRAPEFRKEPPRAAQPPPYRSKRPPAASPAPAASMLQLEGHSSGAEPRKRRRLGKAPEATALVPWSTGTRARKMRRLDCGGDQGSEAAAIVPCGTGSRPTETWHLEEDGNVGSEAWTQRSSVRRPRQHPGQATAIVPCGTVSRPTKTRHFLNDRGNGGSEAWTQRSSVRRPRQHRGQACRQPHTPEEAKRPRWKKDCQLQLAEAVGGRLSPTCPAQLPPGLDPRNLLQYEERMRHMAKAEALAMARGDLEAKARALKVDSLAVKAAEDALAAAMEAKGQKRAELSALKRESDSLKATISNSFLLLRSGACRSCEEAQHHIAAVQQAGRRLGLEAGLLLALPAAAMARPCEREPRDASVFSSLEANFSVCLDEFEGRLSRASREALNALEAVPKADAALDTAKERQKHSYEAFYAAMAAQRSVEQAMPRRGCPTGAGGAGRSAGSAAWVGATPRRGLPALPPTPSHEAKQQPRALEDRQAQDEEEGDSDFEAPPLLPFWEEEDKEEQELQSKEEPELQSKEDEKSEASVAAAGSSPVAAGAVPGPAESGEGEKKGAEEEEKGKRQEEEGKACRGRGRGHGRGRGARGSAAVAPSAAPKAPAAPKDVKVPAHLENTACAILVVLGAGGESDLSSISGLSRQDVEKVLAHRERNGPLESLAQLPLVLGRRVSVKKLLSDNNST